ncbi:hypothetical protein JQK87_28815 [Streptomyces sp. G44]|uniref:hypothetical protein n=1 Tax=Streptomyces sp. G44 TaxID=2807632 RepID=UPI001960C9F1|nr:hypothetical protein [Streptomyces sp. G44]MBM7172324.1 hypothetical protein [Streptomyces sp. G44]
MRRYRAEILDLLDQLLAWTWLINMHSQGLPGHPAPWAAAGALEPAPRLVPDGDRSWIVDGTSRSSATAARPKGDGLPHAVLAVATMHNLALAA